MQMKLAQQYNLEIGLKMSVLISEHLATLKYQRKETTAGEWLQSRVESGCNWKIQYRGVLDIH
jgi:hypothetical protein